MKKIIIFGGTGFLGLGLAKSLRLHNYKPILVSRHQPKSDLGFTWYHWTGRDLEDWQYELEGAYAIVNLCGRSVNCIKTPDHCDEILRSRVESTETIGKALKTIQNPPQVWIQMSTAHIYGDPEVMCTESSAFGYGLAPYVGQKWEEAFAWSLPANMRGLRLRTSFVIGKNGGALSTLKKLVRLRLGGKVGSGQQGMSWIHQEDFNRLIMEAIENKSYEGCCIVSAPNPVSQKDFMQSLRDAMKIRIGLPAPELMVRVGAKLFFKTDPELVLYGRYVRSEKLKKWGFKFKFPELKGALVDLAGTS